MNNLEKVFLVLNESFSNTKRTKNVIRVVSWDNKKPVLEKRVFYKDGTDNWIKSRIMGFNQDEMEMVVIKIGEIYLAMREGEIKVED